MKLITAARSLVRRATQAIDPAWFSRLGSSSFFLRGATPPTRGLYELMASYRRSPWLRSVGGKIAQHVASVEWYIKVPRDSAGKAVRLRALQTARYESRMKLYSMLAKDITYDIVTDHPLLELIEQANPLMTGFDAREATQLMLDHAGESFWALQFDEVLGLPVAYWPIPPTWVTRLPDASRPVYDVNIHGLYKTIPADSVMWLRYRDPADPYGRGVGYAESLADELDTDEFAARFIKSFFYNRAQPDLLVGVEDADDEQLEMARLKFEEKHRGHWKAHRTHFYSGKIDIHELTSTFKDTEVSNLRSWERDAVRAVFGVPAEIMGLTAYASRAAVTQSSRIMALEVSTPRLEFLRQQMQAYLVPYFDDRIVLEYVSPVPDDKELQLSYMQAVPYAATRGEWRAAQGLEDRGAVDNVHMMPLSIFLQRPAAGTGVPAASGGGATMQMSADELRVVVRSVADRIADRLRPETIQVEIDPIWQEEVDEWGKRVQAGLGVKPNFTLLNPLVREHLEDFSSNKIVGVNETTKAAVRATLSEGVLQGEGIRDLGKRIEAVMDDRKGWQAERVARTEVIGSSNFASNTAMAASGVVFEKQWVSTLDDRTRDTHVEMNGDIVGINELFTSPSGATAMYPGGFGVASEDINCFLPDTPVSGLFVGASRAQYSGDVVRLKTAGGCWLATTISHPIMTPDGPVAANALCEGDRILCQRGPVKCWTAEKVYGSRLACTIRVLHRLMAEAGLCTSMKVGSQSFHGDGHYLSDPSVDIVALAGATRPATPPQMFTRLQASGLIVPGTGGGPQLKIGPTELITALGAPWHECSEQAPDMLTRLLFAYNDSVVIDEVASVDYCKYRGEVYDAQTMSGILSAGGILASNCRCTTVGVVDDPKSADELAIVWRQFDREARKWEDRAKAGLVRALNRQTEEVLNALEAVYTDPTQSADTDAGPEGAGIAQIEKKGGPG